MVSSYLQRARNETDRIRLQVRSSGQTPRQAFNNGSLPYANVDLSSHIEQLNYMADWVAVAVMAIARRAASQPLLLADANKYPKASRHVKSMTDTLVPLESHLLLDAFDNPNPLMTRWALMFSTIASLQLTGVAYWWITQNEAGTPEVWPLSSGWVFPLDRMHTKYEVRPIGESLNTFQVTGDRMCRFSIPHPADLWRVLSPLQTQAAAVDADESLQSAQAMSFRNGLFPALGVVAGDVTDLDDNSRKPLLDDDQRNMIYDALAKMFEGPGKYGRAIILDALIRDIKVLTNKPVEMDFLNSGKAMKERIFQAFGVNPIIVGETNGANYAQAFTAEQNFCDNTVNPLLELMSQAIEKWVCPLFAKPKEKLRAWIEPCHAQDRQLALAEWATGLQYGCVTRNAFAQRVLGVPAIPGGDVPLLPGAMIPADAEPVKRASDEPAS